jgi:hypothetical protein
MKEIVDVGAFRCPRWFAEGLMALIALEAANQGKIPKKAAVEEADAWLEANGYSEKGKPEGG